MTFDVTVAAANRKICPTEPVFNNCKPSTRSGMYVLGTSMAAVHRLGSDASRWSATRTKIGKVPNAVKPLRQRNTMPWMVGVGYPPENLRWQTWTERST